MKVSSDLREFITNTRNPWESSVILGKIDKMESMHVYDFVISSPFWKYVFKGGEIVAFSELYGVNSKDFDETKYGYDITATPRVPDEVFDFAVCNKNSYDVENLRLRIDECVSRGLSDFTVYCPYWAMRFKNGNIVGDTMFEPSKNLKPSMLNYDVIGISTEACPLFSKFYRYDVIYDADVLDDESYNRLYRHLRMCRFKNRIKGLFHRIRRN